MSEPLTRLVVFLGSLALLATAESLWPRQRVPGNRQGSRIQHLILGGVNVLAARLLLPWTAYSVAQWSGLQGYGLLRLWALSEPASLVAALLILDLSIYLQHWAMHRFGPLWRLHAVHHEDPFLDVTTGLRFHPGEILLSAFWKFLVVLAIGATPLSILVFELCLSTSSLFTHANISLPTSVSRTLEVLLVTPDLHREHHRPVPAPQLRQFGFNFSFWDRLFGTRARSPILPPVADEVGLLAVRQPARNLAQILARPFL